MFTLKIDNHKGQIVELTHDTGRYAVIGIDGLTRPPTTINTAIAASIDGSFHNSSRVEQRNLVISIILRGKIEENRQALYQIFPCKTACTIYFENKNRNVKIDGYVETLEGDLFVMQERMQISIICTRPYFEDLNAIYTEISTTIKRFSFPFSISQPIPLGEVLDTPHAFITNYGDTDTGFTLTGEINKALTTLTITNLTTGAYFTLNYAFAAGDIITLCTIQGRLSVQIQRSGAVINLLNKVDENSSWIKLQAGYNDLTFSCGEEEPDFPLAITALWLYGGV
jgi:hypothetical protein